MSDNTDFYKILNLSKNASQEEIKKKWRVFAQKYHPDAQYGKTDEEKKAAEELFKQGKSNTEISKELKTNYNYVYKITKQLTQEM